MFTVTKTYRDLPAAHRQPNHDGHCKLIHGHDWRFDITFGCDELDACQFVIDVGKLAFVKGFLTEWFDHTLLLNQDDPARAYLQFQLMSTTCFAANIKIVPSCGMEGLSRFVFEEVSKLLLIGPLDDENRRKMKEEWERRGLRVVEVTCWEDSKNRATYRPS